MNDEKVIVSDVDSLFSRKTGLEKGMLIDSIDSKSISDRISFLRQFVSAGRRETENLFIEKINLLSYRNAIKRDSLRISYRDKDLKKNACISWSFKDLEPQVFNKYFYNYERRKVAGYSVIREDVLYLNSFFWKKEDTDTTLKLLRKCNNVIIDTRDYSNRDFINFASVFVEDSAYYVKFMYTHTFPGLLEEVDIMNSDSAHNYYFPGRIAVLVSESTQSMPELLTMRLKARKNNVVLIGRATAGADGDISTIPMIGNQDLHFKISGLRVLYPNGQETQRIGIPPDIIVEKTNEEVLGQKDSILQKSIQYFDDK